MVPKIPAEFDDELLRRANAGETTRQLADWLVDEKKLRCSHVTVSRRLFGLRAAQAKEPDESVGELRRQIFANEILVQDADEVLAELQELALYGSPEEGVQVDYKEARAIAFKRANLALAQQRYLLARVRIAREAAQNAYRDMVRKRLNATPKEIEEMLEEVAAGLETEEEGPLDPVPAPKPEPVRVEPSPPRNAPCSCGSGKKYKKCCGGPKAPELPAVKQGVKQEVKQT